MPGGSIQRGGRMRNPFMSSCAKSSFSHWARFINRSSVRIMWSLRAPAASLSAGRAGARKSPDGTGGRSFLLQWPGVVLQVGGGVGQPLFAVHGHPTVGNAADEHLPRGTGQRGDFGQLAEILQSRRAAHLDFNDLPLPTGFQQVIALQAIAGSEIERFAFLPAACRDERICSMTQPSQLSQLSPAHCWAKRSIPGCQPNRE